MIVVVIVTAGNSRGAGMGNVAAPARPVQTATSAVDHDCSMLTKQDAAIALGETVTGPKIERSPNRNGVIGSVCVYEGSRRHRVLLMVARLPANDAARIQGVCAQQAQEGLSGLGDVACWYNEGHDELWVFKGTTFLSFHLFKDGDPTDAIKGLAQKVFDQLR